MSNTLAMMVGILSSLLSGSGYGAESGTPEKGAIPGKDAQFFIALNIGAFEDIDRFKKRLDGIIRKVHTSRLRPGFDRIYVPGEIEEELAARYRAEGIPLNDETLRRVAEAARARGVDAAAIA